MQRSPARCRRQVCEDAASPGAPGDSGAEELQTMAFAGKLETLAMVSRKAVAGLLVVYVVSMLAEQTDGFVPFFTQSDFRKMQLQEKERNKAGQKKSLPALQRREEEGFSERAAADVSEVKSIQLTDRCRIRRESLLKLEYSTYVNEICKRD
ncbi:Mln [Columba guinea]|nr:Mln [Columba guinea]